MPSKLRKGGDARYVLAPVAQGDSFIIPRGFKIREVISDTIGATTTAPTVTLGTVAPVQHTGTITVSNAATTGAGSTAFAVGGVTADTQLTLGSTMAQTVAYIQGIYGKGGNKYSLLLNAGFELLTFNATTGVITYVGSPIKAGTAITATYGGGALTQTMTTATVVTGTVNASLMTSQTLATAAKTITDHSASLVAGKAFLSANETADTVGYASFSLNAIGNANLYIVLQKLN